MKLKNKNLSLILGIFLALSGVGHAQSVIYSDSFESDAVNSSPPAGWQDIGTGTGNGAFADVQTGSSYSTPSYTGFDGTHAVYLYLNGLTGSTATSQSNSFSNLNLGHIFAANTTYSLTYLYGANDGGAGTINVSLMANGAVISSSTQSIGAPAPSPSERPPSGARRTATTSR